MKNFNYLSTEGILLDEIDTVSYIVWKIMYLKSNSYSEEFIRSFILSDESIVGDIKELEQFVNLVLKEGYKYF